MGIRFFCPNGHKLNVKSELAGKIGICPKCQARMMIPKESTRRSTRQASGPAPTETEADKRVVDVREKENVDIYAVAANEETAERTTAQTRSDEAGALAEEKTSAANGIVGTGATGGEPLNGPLGQFFGGEERRVEAAFGDVLRRAVDVSAQNGRDAERFEDAEPLRDARLLWYVRSSDNQQYGPAPGDVMATWISERRITPQALVWREGWESWEQAGRVFPELERVFTVGDPTARDAGTGASTFADLAEAAQNSGAARRFAADEEARALRRRKRATKTFFAIAGLIALILGLLGALIFVLTKQ